MNLMRLLGIGVVVAGVFFLIVGLNATNAPVEQLSQTFMGKYTHETLMYIAGGLAAIIAGAVVAIQPR